MKAWINFGKDNESDTAQGGRGNWVWTNVPNWLPEDEWADWLSEQTGWLVAGIEKV